VPTNDLQVFLDGIRLVLQVRPSESGRDVSGKFDFILIRVGAQMKVLVVKSDSAHQDIRCLQEIGSFGVQRFHFRHDVV